MAYVLGPDLARCRDRFPTATPFGDDVTEQPLFLELRAEIDKLGPYNSIDDGSVDWSSVKSWSVEILAERSKDLKVASYLTVALFALRSYPGLADSLEILEKLVREDWDGIFPANVRPRSAILRWLVERLAPAMEAKAPDREEAAVLPALRGRITTLQEAVRSRLADQSPAFNKLEAALAPYLEADLAAAPEPGAVRAGAETPARAADPVPAASLAAAPPQPPAGVEAPAAGTAEEAADRIRAQLPVLRQAAPLSPVSYRVLRSLKWDGVTAAPPLNPAGANPGTTRIDPPRPQQRAALESLHAAGNWGELLHASEGAFQDAGATFWLDLQRYTAAALEGLDPRAGQRAAEAVKEEVVRLTRRLPDLASLYFADRTTTAPGRPNERTVERTPFASEETRRWIEALQADATPVPDLVLPAVASVDAGEPGLSPAEARTAQDLLSRQQLGAAFDLLQTAVDKAPNARARFRTRLAAARLCLQGNQAAWARALLEELLEESEAFRFDDWEPETAADLYQLLALCYSRPARKGGPADADAARAQIETLRRKLFRLNLRAAAMLEEALKR